MLVHPSQHPVDARGCILVKGLPARQSPVFRSPQHVAGTPEFSKARVNSRPPSLRGEGFGVRLFFGLGSQPPFPPSSKSLVLCTHRSARDLPTGTERLQQAVWVVVARLALTGKSSRALPSFLSLLRHITCSSFLPRSSGNNLQNALCCYPCHCGHG